MPSSAEVQARKARTRPAHQVERFYEYSLLGLLTSGFLALAGSGYLDVPVLALTTAGILLRTLMVAGVLHLQIPDKLITAAALAYIGFYPLDWQYLSKDFIQATVHLVCFLAVAKLLTAKTGRDYSYVKIIAFLELLAAAILSANINFFFFLALFLAFGVASFACSEIRRSSMRQAQVVRGGLRLFHWRLTALTLWMTLGILLMTAGMFFLLPRTARAAFQHLSERYHLSGFSNEVTLGQIGEIQQRSTTVMHVRFEVGKPPGNLKWRGASLSEFDGRRWFNRPGRGEELPVDGGMIQLVPNGQILRQGRRFSYVVYAKALATDALFVAGTPEYLYTNSPFVTRGFGGTLRAGFGRSDTRRYAVHSFIEDARSSPPPRVVLAHEERQTYLRLPVLDARVARLAMDLTSQQHGDGERARAIESYLRRSFGYTTTLLEKPVPDPLAHFLFERRKGHCEYFASSMAVMLRTLGIPSRVITGFQSGVYNPVSGWQMIRASDAHSWVEAYLPDAGWTVFDPTPPDATSRTASIWTRALFYVDAMEVFWQDWVLNYDLDRQVTLAARMEQSGRTFSMDGLNRLLDTLADWRKSAAEAARDNGMPVLGTACVLTLLALIRKPAIRSWRTRRRVQKLRRGEVVAGDGTLLYLRMLSILRRRGFEKPAWLTPVEFVRVLPSDTVLLVEDLTLAYNDLRFGGNREAAQQMMLLLDRLEKHPALVGHSTRR